MSKTKKFLLFVFSVIFLISGIPLTEILAENTEEAVLSGENTSTETISESNENTETSNEKQPIEITNNNETPQTNTEAESSENKAGESVSDSGLTVEESAKEQPAESINSNISESTNTPIETNENTSESVGVTSFRAANTASLAPASTLTVKMSGQYSGTSGDVHSFNKSEIRTFTSMDSELGRGDEHEGLFNHLRTNFVGWTDMPLKADGDVQDGARLYLPKDKLSTAFPNGLTGNDELYAVYVNLNLNVSSSNIWGILSMLNGKVEDVVGLKDLINSDKNVEINGSVDEESALTFTEVSKVETGTEKILDETGKDVDVESTTILDFYKTAKDTDVHEVVLKSSFEMNERTALLVYANPGFGYEWKGVLTENYKTVEMMTDKVGKDAGYTHIDLTITIDDRVNIPDNFYLGFKNYSYRPLYVRDDNGYLDILNPNDGSNLGATKDSFNSLISNTSPDVFFAVSNPNKSNKFVIRTILRDGVERINSIDADSTETAAEKVITSTELVLYTKEELKTMIPNLSEEELNKKIFTVDDTVVKELAKTNGMDTLKISGYVDGVARSSVGVHNLPFLGSSNLYTFTPVLRTYSNLLKLGYIDTFDVKYEFLSDSGVQLPASVVSLLPPTLINQKSTTNVVPPLSFPSVNENGGRWVFVGWNLANQVVVDSDLTFVGTWKFIKDSIPTSIPTTPTVTKVEPKLTCADEGKVWNESKQACVIEGALKVHVVPNTATNISSLSYYVISLISVLGIVALKLKSNK